MKRKIFVRIFLLSFLSALLVFLSGIVAIDRNTKNVVENRLTVEAELLSHIIRSEDDIGNLSTYKNADAFRMTVIDESGNVLYESNTSGALESHAGREEVKAALAGTPRATERYSETFRCNMTYYAVKDTLDNGRVIVIRLAVKSSEISGFLGVAVPLLMFSLVVSFVISLFLSGHLSGKLSGNIGAVADRLRSVNTGKYRPLEVDSGEPEFYAVFLEINELNEKTCAYMETQKREKEKLSTVLDNIAQGLFALDKIRRVVLANNSAIRMFDGADSDIGKDLIFLIDDPELCHRIENTSDDESFEYRIGDKILSVTLRRIENTSLAEELSAIVIITDITKTKMVAKEKSDFFANASHELKTPITVILGNSELILAKDKTDDTAHKQIERIHTEALRMSQLISDMLQLSRLEQSAKEEAPLVSIDLGAVSEEVAAELSASAATRQIEIFTNGHACVSADPKKMYELVENLCSNAVHYNKDGGKVTVSVSEKDGHTTLVVADTGIGIPKEHLPRICERFYRVDKSHSKKTGGTGLGLAIVKHICALYGASLSIESEPDVGTTVTVTF